LKIYTKTGDDGTTGLQNGKRVTKSDLRIRSYGAVDEVNASLGIVLSNKLDDDLKDLLIKIQNDLFLLGSDLSNPDMTDSKNRVVPEMTDFLEHTIDKFDSTLPELTNFILPGGSITASLLHSTRSITRRAESLVVELSNEEHVNSSCIHYLNRLSDLFFVMCRVLNKNAGQDDIIWKP